MDDDEWPNIPNSIAGLRAALECGYGLWYSVPQLSMYLSQLGGALRLRGRTEEPIVALRAEGLAADILRMLREGLRAPEPEIRASACSALDYLGDPAVVTDLRPLLHDSDAMVSVRAAYTLRGFSEPSGTLIPRLIEILSCPEGNFPQGNDRIQGTCGFLQMPEAHCHAARILSYCGTEAAPAREQLLTALESVSGTVRAEAAKALAGMGESPTVYLPPLRQALHDDEVQSSRERVRAAEGLIDLGEPPESVVPVLIELARDQDYGACVWAIELLGKVGPAASSAIPMLQEAKALEDQGLGEAAFRALQSIGVPQG